MPIIRDAHEFDDLDHVGPYVHQFDYPDDRSERPLTSEKCTWCRASLDYCRQHPCGSRVAAEQPNPCPHCGR